MVSENPETGEYERVMWFHDWVIDHCEYDYSYTYYSAADLLLGGTGVCNSYVRALALLLDADGIDYRRIIGEYNGFGHTWIAVSVDGIWCLVDPTWDDMYETGDIMRHLYYGVTDALFSIEHENPYYIGGAVTCDSMANCYLVWNDRWRDSNFGRTVLESLQEQLDAGQHCFLMASLDYRPDFIYDTCVVGEALAWGLSHGDLTDSRGRDFRADFLFDADAVKLIGRDPGGSTLALPGALKAVSQEAFAPPPPTG